VLPRLAITPHPLVSPHGESYQNLLETHVNIPRRLYDYPFAHTTPPTALEQRHQRFMTTYNTTAHYGFVQEGFTPPIPLWVLGDAKGRLYAPDERTRKFSQALFPRTTNPYGCGTLHRDPFYVEAGLPQTQILLWVYGEPLRAVLDHGVLAEYHCRDDGRAHKVTDIHDGVFYPTRLASPQGTLLPFNPHEALVLYRPTARPSQVPRLGSSQQLWLFALLQRVSPGIPCSSIGSTPS
jgi:hypothetical protein